MFATHGISRFTRIPALEDQQVAEHGPLGLGEPRHEIAFDSGWIGFGGEPKALRQSHDVGVYDDAHVDVERVAEDDVCRFARHAAQAEQIVHCVRDRAVVHIDDSSHRCMDGFGFVSPEVERLHERSDCFWRGLGERLRCWKLCEERRSCFVNADVGCLRREDRCNEQLVRLGVVQLAVRIGIATA